MITLNTEHIFAGAIGFGIDALLISILVIFFVVKCSLSMSGNETISTSLVLFAVFACIFYILQSIFYSMFLLDLIKIISLPTFGVLCNYLQTIFWHFGQISLYCYLTNRVYKSFKGTEYSLKYWTYIIFIIILVIYFIFSGIVIGLAIWYLKSNEILIKNSLHQLLLLISTAVTALMDFILSISLLCIFVNKLYKIGETIYDINNIEMGSIQVKQRSDSQIETINNHKDNIVIIIAKVTVLSIGLVIGSFIVNILAFLHFCIPSSYVYYVFLWSNITQSFLTPLLLIIGFNFTNKWYLFICKCCHNRMQKYYLNKMQTNTCVDDI